ADRPGIGSIQPGEHVGQGRLAGAVLAEQRVDLAGPHLEVDAVVGDDPAREALGDAGRDDGRDDGRGSRGQPFGLPSTPCTNQSIVRISSSVILTPSATRTVPAWSVRGPVNS